MIKLTRVRTQAAIHANFFGQKRLELALGLLDAQRRIARQELTKHAFDDAIWKKAKDMLVKESVGKCAYCETPFKVVAYGDVEHYRPKSVYWWLAYCYDNYLAACQMCNQKFKKDKFPTKNAVMKAPVVTKTMTDAKLQTLVKKLYPDPMDDAAVLALTKLHTKERPWLLNPYVDDPSSYLAWQADDILQEVEVIPLANVADAKDIAEAAITLYGLNRTELKNLRYQTYQTFKVFKTVLAEPTLTPATRQKVQAQITTMKQANASFAGMVRYFDALL